MMIAPPISRPYSGTTIIHHSSPVPSYTSSMTPTCIHPPIPPFPVVSTNHIPVHADIPRGTIGGKYTRTNDSIDCCILI